MIKLRTIFGSILAVFIVFSCGKESNENFTLKGKIKGLKKGVVYLQKDGDSSLITIDSLAISGQPEFELSTILKEPELLYLKLYQNDGKKHFIPFFADKGLTEITTDLKNFSFNATIKGSKQQALLEDYLKVMKRYRDQNLDLIQDSFLAQKNNDDTTADSLSRLSANILKRKYAHTINFALNNKDSEVAPYLVLYEIPNANPVYVDSVYNNLTEAIKSSFYGKKLGEIIAKRTTAK